MKDAARVPMSGFVESGAHVLPVRVYYEDTDFSGVVYHANYLRFLERGRSDSLRALGIDHRTLAARADPLVFVVRRIELDYLKPARIDDALEVRTSYAGTSGVRIQAHQEVWRGGDVLVRAKIEIVCIGDDGRPRRLPQELTQLLERRDPSNG